MGRPAARVGDMHTCPMVDGLKPHVGGPVMPPGKPMVLIGGMPASVVTGLCTCVGPPDSIVKGSTGVFIEGLPAARMGDTTAHGGVIVQGFPMVLIGDLMAAHAGALSPTELAIVNARIMMEKKLAELAVWDANAKANVKKWMGDDSEATRQLLAERLGRAIAALDNMNDGNFKKAEPGHEKCYAYVYANDKSHTVYLGNLFGPAPDTGTDSKAGTLVHEVSHFNDVAGTDDVIHPACGGKTCYGTTNAENLAKRSPSDAQKNADNFEYYIEN